ncbi:AraC family transcriptional regulator [uncultured Roseovarius sp.]|uniref:helix-turn-helix domain-containing protein n=1 Tax=uncultured Roseovarius sp. TaxID=293344 RepID=UPI002603F5A4|nr:AraC family transcriptional regulator [uncultured Roseovarius sp.]
MRQVPLVRAAHLNVYLAALREIGAPIDGYLKCANLPATVEETPDSYLSVPQVLACVSASGSDAAMELGFVAAQSATLEELRPEFQRAILDAPSLFARLKTIMTHASREDGALVTGIGYEGAYVRVICDLAGFHRSAALAYSEWLQVQAVISIVRTVAGSDWCPEEMTFVSRRKPPDSACDAYPNTRILMNSPQTSVLVPPALIGLPCPPLDKTVDETGNLMASPDGLPNAREAIREIVKAYLPDRPLRTVELANILGTSERTLQRHLARQGLTFHGLVAEARYQVACQMLAQPDAKIIDIAFSAGYKYPSHFTRAFRRVAGVTPSTYRRSLKQG